MTDVCSDIFESHHIPNNTNIPACVCGYTTVHFIGRRKHLAFVRPPPPENSNPSWTWDSRSTDLVAVENITSFPRERDDLSQAR